VTWFGVVNPGAGRSGSPYAQVVAEAERVGLDGAFEESGSSEDVASLVSRAIATGFTRFISVGGDGTANLMLNAIMAAPSGNRFTLGIVSSGSGSDFVRTFGHKGGIAGGLERIVRDDVDRYPIDVGLATGSFGDRYFLNALTVGVTAASVAKADTFPRWVGSSRYTAAFWVALWGFANGPISVRVDGNSFDDDAIAVVVANGQFFGGGLNIAPRSVLNDGKMDVQIFRGPRRQAFSVMPRVKMGSHLTHKGVQRFTGSEIVIDVPQSWPIEADGEMLGSGRIDVQVIPNAIDFVI
jgi:YegS/Rv2252/BmrU family lipid kinase